MSLLRKSLLILVLMLASAVSAFALKPRDFYSPIAAGNSVEALLPERFGDWVTMPDTNGMVLADPEVTAKLNVLYDETVNRTYTNRKSQRIYLSLAYGKNQGRDFQIHKPEVCYPAQGFKLISKTAFQLELPDTTVPAMRLITELGSRTEPVTYWIRSGDYLVSGWFGQNKARILAGLDGKINDGLLVRVSTIGNDIEAGFKLQEEFLRELISTLSNQDKAAFLGRTS